MLCLKSFFVIAAILCLMPEQSQIRGKYQFRHNLRHCYKNKNTIFTTDGTKCYLFRNKCFLINKNHDRYLANKPTLILTTKANCQNQCARYCGKKKSIVCGEYGGSYRYFNNYCELQKTACINGQAIIKVSKAKCDKEAFTYLKDALIYGAPFALR